MAQSTTMFSFHDNSGSLLERRQQSAPYLQQLELPSLPPLSQIIDKKELVQATAATIAAMEAAATASMITSTAQPLIQHEAFLPATTITSQPISNPTLLYNGDFNKTSPVMNTSALYMDPTSANYMEHQIFNTAAVLTDPTMMNYQRESSVSSNSSDNKKYSFVAIPGTNQHKRPRRRYDEIERLYHCNWPGCTKSYGTLNHLNAHVSMQQHGAKRHPTEFKEMRKEWRRQKKERDMAKKQAEQAYKNQMYYPPPPPPLPASAYNNSTLFY